MPPIVISTAHLLVATQARSYMLCSFASAYSARYACVEVILLFIDNWSKKKLHKAYCSDKRKKNFLVDADCGAFWLYK